MFCNKIRINIPLSQVELHNVNWRRSVTMYNYNIFDNEDGSLIVIILQLYQDLKNCRQQGIVLWLNCFNNKQPFWVRLFFYTSFIEFKCKNYEIM